MKCVNPLDAEPIHSEALREYLKPDHNRYFQPNYFIMERVKPLDTAAHKCCFCAGEMVRLTNGKMMCTCCGFIFNEEGEVPNEMREFFRC